jgi:hypothetical protein
MFTKPDGEIPMESANISAMCLSISINSDMFFFLMMDDQGTVNRMGPNDGTDGNGEMFIGQVDEKLFETLREKIPAESFDILGKTLEQPDREGDEVQLEMVLRIDGADQGFSIICNMQDGIPDPFFTFFDDATKLTHDWHEKQIAMVQKASQGVN